MDQSIDKSAPEAITEAVASLPPEQMFELMKKMKDCVVNNPQEARDMLLKNTQLAYALFQGLVVMKIVDPEMAISMLHKQVPKPSPIGVQGGNQDRFNRMDQPQHQHPPPHHTFGGGPGGPGPGQAEMERRDPRMEEPMRFDRRDPRESRDPRDPRERFSADRESRERDPRPQRDPRDPRGGGNSRRPHMEAGPPGGPPPGVPPQFANNDPKKAQLIRQVLQLTPEQIAMLPAEQQASIMELKKQIENK